MISLKVLSAAAILTLTLPVIDSAPSYAQGGRHGHHGGGWHHRVGGGFLPGALAGAVIGGAIASQNYYNNGYYGAGSPYYGNTYYGNTYAAQPYYDAPYDDEPVVQVAPAGGGDDVAYCMQRYRSYDPRSGTYLNNDGTRYPCP